MSDKIRVKLISKNIIAPFQLFDLPQHFPQIEFVLDTASRAYDWLVVYDDLPPKKKERLGVAVEPLACPPENTILLTYEPASIKFYGQDYVDQFAMVLTSHEEEALRHRNRHAVPPVGVWYYGELAAMQAHPTPPPKSKNLSCFHSLKQQKHTLHQARHDFMQKLIDALGAGIDVYGRNFQPVQHKQAGMDAYRYHLAVENHIGTYHWTEKLSDCFLAYNLPFYVGCPRYMDYFPPESVIPLDIRQPKTALKIIREAMANNEYEKRLPAIIEARRRVIEDYNLGNVLGGAIVAELARRDNVPLMPNDKDIDGKILSRHAMLRHSLAHFSRYAIAKLVRKNRNKKFWRSYMQQREDS